MKIGIIGCGYVGQAAAQWWKQKGHTVSATTRTSEKSAYLQTLVDHVYVLDDTHYLSEFIANQEALLIAVAPDSNSDYETTYLKVANEVASTLLASETTLKQVLYTSSTSVYGEHQGNWVDEKTQILPPNDKAFILHETENILLNCSSELLNVCIFRLGEIYGPNREISQRLHRMSKQPLAGTGEAFTNLSSLEDIIRGLDFSLKHQLNGIYNLCGDLHIPRRELYDILCKKEGLSFLKWDASQTNPHTGNKRVSNQKLKTAGFVFSEAFPYG